MLGDLTAALLINKSVTTTEQDAQKLRVLVERLITSAKRGGPFSRRRALSVINDKEAVHLLFSEIVPLVADHGGHTRLRKLGNREGDNAAMVTLELVLESPPAAELREATSSDHDGQGSSPIAIATMERDRSSRRVYFGLPALSRDDLQSIAQSVDLRVLGYGRSDSWVIASRELRGAPEDPAFLQISRADATRPWSYEIGVSWIGSEPPVAGLIQQITNAIQSHGLAEGDMRATGTAQLRGEKEGRWWLFDPAPPSNVTAVDAVPRRGETSDTLEPLSGRSSPPLVESKSTLDLRMDRYALAAATDDGELLSRWTSLDGVELRITSLTPSSVEIAVSAQPQAARPLDIVVVETVDDSGSIEIAFVLDTADDERREGGVTVATASPWVEVRMHPPHSLELLSDQFFDAVATGVEASGPIGKNRWIAAARALPPEHPMRGVVRDGLDR